MFDSFGSIPMRPAFHLAPSTADRVFFRTGQILSEVKRNLDLELKWSLNTAFKLSQENDSP